MASTPRPGLVILLRPPLLFPPEGAQQPACHLVRENETILSAQKKENEKIFFQESEKKQFFVWVSPRGAQQPACQLVRENETKLSAKKERKEKKIGQESEKKQFFVWILSTFSSINIFHDMLSPEMYSSYLLTASHLVRKAETMTFSKKKRHLKSRVPKLFGLEFNQNKFSGSVEIFQDMLSSKFNQKVAKMGCSYKLSVR